MNKKQVPIIIKPKEKQQIEKTKNDLNNRVSPDNLNILKVQTRKNGTVVVQSKNNEEREKIKNALQSELSESYDINIPDEPKMTIIVTDMSFKIPDEEIIGKIKKQNIVLNNCELKLVKTYEFKKNDRTIYNAKIIVDKETYEKVISIQKLNIGWDRCRIFDGTDVIRCYKCNGFNHKAAECNNEEVCYKCHGKHKSKECKNEIVSKCLNCIHMKKTRNLELDENHTTISKECPVYKKKLEIKKKNIGLNI